MAHPRSRRDGDGGTATTEPSGLSIGQWREYPLAEATILASDQPYREGLLADTFLYANPVHLNQLTRRGSVRPGRIRRAPGPDMITPPAGRTTRQPAHQPERLGDFLKRHRARVKPQELGMAARTGGRGRSAPGLTQAQVAQLMSLDPRHYQRIEGGKATPTEEQLDHLARILRLREPERIDLYLHALKRPPVTAQDPESASELCAYWRFVVPAIGHQVREHAPGQVVVGPLAYASNMWWDVDAYNQAFADMFGEGDIPTNIFRWMAWEGRDQLPEHSTYWLSRALPQLDALLRLHPDRRELRELADWVERTIECPAAPSSYQHPDGDVRPVLHHRYGYGSLVIGAAAPMGGLGSRLIMMHFYQGLTPDELRRRFGHCTHHL
ncbi:helix-turn-helix domain-containing protein [Kitasatospora sp. NPDC052896]|uniref:helix-turn-helix domain-containing protein n=1 Tax=Kitasatospora sp. NPDC052896 TaxID=3364061 RepID=UPI0037C62300